MRRLLLAITLTASALSANTFTFTSCTQGTTTLTPCGGTYLIPGGLPDAHDGAGASDSAILPGDGLDSRLMPIPGAQIFDTTVSGQAFADTVPVSETAIAKAYGTYLTPGPERPGLIRFDVSLIVLHYGNPDAVFSDGIHNYDYTYNGVPSGSTPPQPGSCFESCAWTATVPFELGVPFDVTAETSNGASFPAQSSRSPGANVHGGSEATVEFTLFEADGTTPAPFFAVPEPATWALLSAALLGFAIYFRRASHRASKRV